MRVQRTSGLVAGMSAVGLALTAGAAGAQSAAPQLDTRWRAFAGCWAPGSDSATPLVENAPVVCVAPAEGSSAVELVAVADGKVVARERVVASGERVSTERDGCKGWEQASWSADGHRLFRRADFTCANGVRRVTQGVFAIGPAGEWLDIRGAGTGASAGVIAIRYRPTGSPAGLPAEIAAVVPTTTSVTYDARAFAAAPLTGAEIVEASKQLDAPVAATLLVERGQGFDLDGKKLVALADQGVPGRVIDAMVALSNPRVFAINRNGGTPDRRLPESGDQVATGGRTIPVYMDPFGWPYGYGYGYGSSYGYGRYGAYGRNGFGYGPYGSYGGYYGGGPVIVVRPPSDGDEGGRGRAVNGRGYTRRGGSDSPRTSGDVGRSSGGSSGGSSSGGSSAGSSGGSSSGSSGGGRTAKPRDP
jgi:hypothetical protein